MTENRYLSRNLRIEFHKALYRHSPPRSSYFLRALPAESHVFR